MTPRELLMRRAIALSLRGFPAPNPRVGCVLAHDLQIVGEGWHAAAGGPHAEVVALQAAGKRARGAIAYVTLEPCNHHGRTGPCTEALLAAGVRHVVVAVRDPNPRAAGGGEVLEAAGVQFEHGLMEARATAANSVWLGAMRRGRPYVTVKFGVSLDGRIALPTGESQWITGPASRRQGHRLRAEMGAVLVGRRTVEADDPQLTARLRGVKNQPMRIVLDPESKLAGTERVFDPQAQTLRITAQEPRTAFDVTVERSERGLELEHVLRELWSRGVTGLLVEGGAATARGFFEAGLVDRLDLFIAPTLLGAGPTWLQACLAENLAGAPRLAVQRVKRLDEDVWLTLVARD